MCLAPRSFVFNSRPSRAHARVYVRRSRGVSKLSAAYLAIERDCALYESPVLVQFSTVCIGAYLEILGDFKMGLGVGFPFFKFN